ncbi:TolC family protein [Akkermansiaceae bacterium]|nr:TolC family protein [Akkermansiaceae bacterium]
MDQKLHIFTSMKQNPTFKIFGAQLPLAIAIAAGLAAPNDAQAESALYISYRTIPFRIEKDNLELRAARVRIAEAQGRHNQSGRLTNPVVGAEVSAGRGFRERGMTVSLTQAFPLTKRLSLEKNVTQKDIELALVEVADVKRRLVGDARQALIRFLAISEQRSLRMEQISLAEELEKSLNDAAKKGEVSALDAGLVSLEVMQLKTEVRQLEAQIKAINGEIKPLLGLPVEKLVTVGDRFQNLGGINIKRRNVLARADIKAAQMRIGEAKAREELERAKKFSDIEVSIFAGLDREEDAPNGFENEGIIGIEFSLPLPFWDDNGGNIQEAEARVWRRRLELDALTKKAQHEVKAANDELKEWLALVKQVDSKLLPAAEKQYQLANKSYREGLSDIQTVLRSREKLLQLRQSRINALSEFYQARARYESALGY